MTCKYIM